MFNKITFESRSKELFFAHEKPLPSIKKMPDWWKKTLIKTTYGYSEPVPTLKRCGPMIDSIGAGYILTLWFDLEVKRKDGKVILTGYHDGVELDNVPVKPWDNVQVGLFEKPYGFTGNVYKYEHEWIIKTPKKWSTIFMHPLGYNDLPIRSVPGIVDTGTLKTPINCPFIIRDDFEGVISQGTPISQLIPIKTSNWKANYIQKDGTELMKEKNKILDYGFGYYYDRKKTNHYK
jgi:hypothetical protein